MKIKSDKQNKNNTSLKNNLKLKLIKMLTYLILSVLISSFYYYISENFWAIYCGIVSVVIMIIISEGEIFNEETHLIKLYFWITLIATPICWLETPISTKTDRMDISNFVANVEKDSEQAYNTTLRIDFKNPFEKNMQVKIENKYASMMLDKNEFGEFKFEAEKNCEKLRYGEIDCTINLIIWHKYQESPLVETKMKNSIYPKRLDMGEN